MKVTLRRKKINNNRESLYLDIYKPLDVKKRHKEYLKLYILSVPKNKKEKEINKETLLLAESIAAKKLLEIQDETYDFKKKAYPEISFIDYFRKQAEKRNSKGNWTTCIRHVIIFSNQHISFKEIDEKWVENFRHYLKNDARTMDNKALLSQNSRCAYFSKFKACFKQAYKDKIIPNNPAVYVKGFSQQPSQREFLTLNELQKLVNIECYIPVLKTAFLFSALTGLRWSDISKLTWEEVQHSEELGYYLRYTQAKTSGVETLPISEQAFKLLGDRKEPKTRIFKGLKYGAYNNLRLAQWLLKAGITKHITFHCARHTYATLQLTFGTDIYTVSKLLGHKDIKTTQIYANIINEKKVEAANKIPDIF